MFDFWQRVRPQSAGRRAVVKSVLCASIAAFLPSSAQAQPASSAEIQALHAQLDALRRRLDQLEARATPTPAPGNTGVVARSPLNQNITFGGFIQADFRSQSGETANSILGVPTANAPGDQSSASDFDVRRARLDIQAAVTRRLLGRIQLDAPGTVTLRDAYLDAFLSHPSRGVRVRLGQFQVPYSTQVLESAATRLTPEESLINTHTVPADRDRGILLEVPFGRLPTRSPALQLALFNGTGLNVSDNNTDKDVVVGLLHRFSPFFSGRLSYLSGDYRNTETGVGLAEIVPKRRLSADFLFNQNRLNVQLQYSAGRGDFPNAGGSVSDTRVRGGYAQIAYRVTEIRPITLVARYQAYNPDAGNDVTVATLAARERFGRVRGPLLGIVYDPSRSLRFLSAFEQLDNDRVEGKRQLFTLRSQVRF